MFNRFLTPTARIAAGLLILVGAFGLSTAREASAQQEAEILATVQAIENAWNSHDAFTFREFFTEQAFESEFGFSKSDIEQVAATIGDPPIMLTAENISVENGTASADVLLDFDFFTSREHWTFTSIDGRWVIDSATEIAPEIPEGSTVVEVQLDEYAFIYDASAVEAGQSVAFAMENIGEEAHEFVLLRVTSNAPLLDLLATDDDEPEGLEFLVFAEADPGASNVAIPPGPLDAGRYAVVCFFPAPDGTPHAILGMVSEFNVGSGASTISPPNTGDGGLLEGSSVGLTSAAALTLGSSLLVLGLVGLTRRAQSN